MRGAQRDMAFDEFATGIAVAPLQALDDRSMLVEGTAPPPAAFQIDTPEKTDERVDAFEREEHFLVLRQLDDSEMKCLVSVGDFCPVAAATNLAVALPD